MIQNPFTHKINITGYAYQCYLQHNASSHPDDFISPTDWLHLWNLCQWMLITAPMAKKPESEIHPYLNPKPTQTSNRP